MMCNTGKGPYAIYGQCRPRSACAFAQADQGLHCPLTKSMDTIVYVITRMPRSDCMDLHAHLDLCCLHMAEGSFPHVTHLIYICIIIALDKMPFSTTNGRPPWFSWICIPLETMRSWVRPPPTKVSNILSWRLIMKYFLWSFSPFH